MIDAILGIIGMARKARRGAHRARTHFRRKWSDVQGHVAQHHPSGSGTYHWASDLVAQLRAERMVMA